MPAGISHCEAIFHMRSVFHKSRNGFISLKKTCALYQSTGLFLGNNPNFDTKSIEVKRAIPLQMYAIDYADPQPFLAWIGMKCDFWIGMKGYLPTI